MSRIISFSGRKGSGKSEVCKYLQNNGYECINFADSLKSIVCELLDISMEYLNLNKDYANKNYSINPAYLTQKIADESIDEDFVMSKIPESFNSIRNVLQMIGTEIIREKSPNWHINKMKQILLQSPNKKFCVSDTRFCNEKELLEELGAEMWFIIRPSNFDISNHASETELSWDKFDNVIVNSSSVDHLIKSFSEKQDCIFSKNYSFLGDSNLECYFAGLISQKSILCVSYERSNGNPFHKVCLTFSHKSLLTMYLLCYVSGLPQNDVTKRNDEYSIDIINPYILENFKTWGIFANNNERDIPKKIQNNKESIRYLNIGRSNGSF